MRRYWVPAKTAQERERASPVLISSPMQARLAPHLRYSSSERPLDDHGARLRVLASSRTVHFMRIAWRETAWAMALFPFHLSHARLLE